MDFVGGRCLWSRMTRCIQRRASQRDTRASHSQARARRICQYTVEYFQLAPGGDVLQHKASCLQTTSDFLESLPEEILSVPNEPGEWTVKKILQHITDDERIYAYRVLRFVRNDLTELPLFDQEVVAAHSGAKDRSLASLFDEYVTVRASTLSLFEGLPEVALTRIGTANGIPMSARAGAPPYCWPRTQPSRQYRSELRRR